MISAGVRIVHTLGDEFTLSFVASQILNSNGEAIAPFLRYFDQCTSVPFVFDPTTRELITYDDSTSVGIKSVSSSYLPRFITPLTSIHAQLFALNQGLAGMYIPIAQHRFEKFSLTLVSSFLQDGLRLERIRLASILRHSCRTRWNFCADCDER